MTLALFLILGTGELRASPSPAVSSSTGSITGKVVSNFYGTFIAGAAVRINDTVIATNGNGEFLFAGVQPGTYKIYYDAADHEGQVQEFVTVESERLTRTPAVIMKAGIGEIVGKVLSAATGLPLQGAVVRIDDIVAVTGPEGEFRFSRVYPGVYTVHYSAPSHLGQIQEVIPVFKNERLNLPTAVLSADGPPRILIKLSENRLYLYFGTLLVKSYRIASGMKSWPTPLGTFTIIRKDVNPTWYPPSWADEEKPVRPGPRNPLGTRRLLLSNPSYGIHGTNRVSSIGRYVTHGCIRLYPWEIVDLFDRVSVGTTVDIVGQ